MTFKCTKCCKLFTCQFNLNAHVNKKTPCFSEEINTDGIKCDFCNNTFSTQSNLNRHIKSCIARKNPELLVKQIEKQKELLEQKNKLLEQKDVLIEQQASTIEQLKEAKPSIDVDNSSNTDNSVNKTIKTTNNIDNSITNNITNNITLVEQPFALRSDDMIYLLQFHENNNKEEYLIMLKNIHKAKKNGDLDGMLNSLFTFIHNNKHLKQGQNIRYCPNGEHKGILIYDYDEKGIGYWRPSDIRPISYVLSQEFDHIHARQRKIDEKNEEAGQVKIPISEKEENNIAVLESISIKIHEDLENQETIIKFIKKLEMSKYVPDNIRNNPQEDNIHPKNEELSPAAIAHKKYIKKLNKNKKVDEIPKSEKLIVDKEQIERYRLHEESRQKRKAEEAEDERKEQEYKRKCEMDGIEYLSKVERSIMKEHNDNIRKQKK